MEAKTIVELQITFLNYTYIIVLEINQIFKNYLRSTLLYRINYRQTPLK